MALQFCVSFCYNLQSIQTGSPDGIQHVTCFNHDGRFIGPSVVL